LAARFAASESDGTDARKAAEIESTSTVIDIFIFPLTLFLSSVDLLAVRAELSRVEALANSMTSHSGSDSLNSSSNNLLSAFAPPVGPTPVSGSGVGAGSAGGVLSGAVGVGAGAGSAGSSSSVSAATSMSVSNVSINLSASPMSVSSSSMQKGGVARAFGAIIDPQSLSEDDFIRIMQAAEQRDPGGSASPGVGSGSGSGAASGSGGSVTTSNSDRERPSSKVAASQSNTRSSSLRNKVASRPLATKSTSPTPTMDRHMASQAQPPSPAALAVSPRRGPTHVTAQLTTLSSATLRLASVLADHKTRDTKRIKWYNAADAVLDVVHMLLKGKRLDGTDRFHKRALTMLESAQRAVKLALKHSDDRMPQQVSTVQDALVELHELLRSLAASDASGAVPMQPINDRALQTAVQLRVVRGLANVEPPAVVDSTSSKAPPQHQQLQALRQSRALTKRASWHAAAQGQKATKARGVVPLSSTVDLMADGDEHDVPDDDVTANGAGATLAFGSIDDDDDASPDDYEHGDHGDEIGVGSVGVVSVGSVVGGGDGSSGGEMDNTTADHHHPPQQQNSTGPIEMVNFERDSVELIDELGRGGSGFVYRTMVGHFSVACKVFYPTTMQEVQLIRREVTTLQQMAHPHVVHMFMADMSRPNEVRCFMELCSCTLLSIVLERRRGANLPASRRRFTPRELVGMLKQVALALEYIHGLSPPVLHRDLKADNVFAQRRHGTDIPLLKLGDFGEARSLPRARRRRLSANVGTLEFRAPEIIVETVTRTERHGIAYDMQCDIWSYGLVVFELLTLSTPYRIEKIHPFKLASLIATGMRPRLPAHVAVAHPDEATAALAWQQLDSLMAAATASSTSTMVSLFASAGSAGSGGGGGGGASGASTGANVGGVGAGSGGGGGGGGGSGGGGNSSGGGASSPIPIGGGVGIRQSTSPIGSPSSDHGSHDIDGELDAEASAAVAAANRVEYVEYVRLFEQCTTFQAKERPSAKELVKRMRKLDQQQRTQPPLNLPAALSKSRARTATKLGAN
jgi:serine/threonine protein kinase